MNSWNLWASGAYNRIYWLTGAGAQRQVWQIVKVSNLKYNEYNDYAPM